MRAQKSRRAGEQHRSQRPGCCRPGTLRLLQRGRARAAGKGAGEQRRLLPRGWMGIKLRQGQGISFIEVTAEHIERRQRTAALLKERTVRQQIAAAQHLLPNLQQLVLSAQMPVRLCPGSIRRAA